MANKRINRLVYLLGLFVCCGAAAQEADTVYILDPYTRYRFFTSWIALGGVPLTISIGSDSAVLNAKERYGLLRSVDNGGNRWAALRIVKPKGQVLKVRLRAKGRVPSEFLRKQPLVLDTVLVVDSVPPDRIIYTPVYRWRQPFFGRRRLVRVQYVNRLYHFYRLRRPRRLARFRKQLPGTVFYEYNAFTGTMQTINPAQ